MESSHTFWSNTMDSAFKAARNYLKDHNLQESNYTLEQVEGHESYGCKLTLNSKEKVEVTYTAEEVLSLIDYILKDENIMTTSKFNLNQVLSNFKSNAKN